MRLLTTLLATLAVSAASAVPVFAQHEGHAQAAAPAAWTWRFDAQVFLTANFQQRRFTDFRQIESQNWFMLAGARPVRRSLFRTHVMASLEPFTERALGSAQVFQVGETYNGAALVDYQHPHDLVMAASAALEWPAGARTRASLEGALVGAPAIGPAPFMHRPSAEANATAPLGHHHLDATHISHGMITAGVTHGPMTFEVSAFHGAEPDEDRVRVEFGPIDSYSARVSWRRGDWQAQVSAGHLRQPNPTEFTDVNRITASLSHAGQFKRRAIAWLLAWGHNAEPGVGVRSHAWLAEGAWHATSRDVVYARGEIVDQDILTVGGYDPPGFHHPHTLSRVAALTLGAERRLRATRAGHFGAGADLTIHHTPDNLADSHGQPWSVHVFLRWRK